MSLALSPSDEEAALMSPPQPWVSLPKAAFQQVHHTNPIPGRFQSLPRAPSAKAGTPTPSAALGLLMGFCGLSLLS